MTRIGRWVALLAVALSAGAAVPASARGLPVQAPVRVDTSSVMPVVWQGDAWLARESPAVRQNPNMNYWLGTPETVFTDSDGRLHLVAKKVGATWYAAGIKTVKDDYGYGTYRFVVDTPMQDLDPMAVIGLFTFNPDVLPSRQEADVELSPWGQVDPTARNGQWVIQPWKEAGHLKPFTVPRTMPMTYEFTWRAKSVKFRARAGVAPDAPIVSSWKSTKALPGKPTPGTQVYINLWFKNGQPPYNGQTQEAVFSSFSYKPLS